MLMARCGSILVFGFIFFFISGIMRLIFLDGLAVFHRFLLEKVVH